jgi:hypothetical protein
LVFASYFAGSRMRARKIRAKMKHNKFIFKKILVGSEKYE